MAQIQPRKPGRKAVRYGVPVAVAGAAAATIGLVPALADTGDPDLPKVTAEELVTKMAKSDVQHMSGTVKINTDLGLPALPGSGGGNGGHGPFGGGDEQRGGDSEEGAEKEGSGADPQSKLMELASGEHTLRVATDGPDKQRVSVVEEAAEYSFIHNGQDIWAYDSASNSAFHAQAPKDAGKGKQHKMPEGMANLTPEKAADQALKAVDKTTSVSVDGTSKVAGRDAYTLVIKPKAAADSTVESVRIAVDADNGAPLKFTLTPDGGGKPVIDIAYRNVDFGKPGADTFEFKAPKGAKVTEKELDGKAPEKGAKPDLSGFDVLGEGWNTVVEIPLPGNALAGPMGGDKEGGGSEQMKRLLDAFTDEAKGDFGTGRVFETRLVNALITDDGKVFAGAVTKDGLVKAADEAAK
ncbi:outer membrane lipoprotein carrier protein LolA [Streptomyces armeniacus]|uniref:Outer membrane lipoprotein carrier protein LolA n=1 Tax=Streptomyces armeniacus TaxID=83291 RepID=A0A345XXW3_9ACTN|nr:DUF2092 domain-containing protein [Streptomyces armeniacus]AXK36479.1 outer membrane lipoprotein carrier protein LolA [Streptomyces armeniacus]